MLDIIHTETAEGHGNPNRAQGMRSGTANAATKTREETFLSHDTYYIGLSRDAVDRFRARYI